MIIYFINTYINLKITTGLETLKTNIMKTKQQIRDKIKEHEDHINILVKDLNDISVNIIENYLKGRMALRWVLNDEDLICKDDYEEKINYEIQCYESTKIF